MPKPLIEVLRKSLARRAVRAATPTPVVALPAPAAEPFLSANAAAGPKFEPVEADVAAALEVQVATFAKRANAQAAAKRLDGAAGASGKLWHVHLGPFASRAEADAARAKARRGRFGDARVISAAS